ncbi:MAG: ethanolamine utilization microcompartment protein EutL [Syntrophaceae bacterium]|nr:ethanolamine utilization microcompartment protein EutL [Syntrophaceae bacterium]
MKHDKLPGTILSARIIPNVSPYMAKEFNLTSERKSLAMISADADDIAYIALDQATKVADVEVVYAKSMYAGAANASTKLAGEFYGAIAGPNPAEAKAGLNAIFAFFGGDCTFVSANEDNSIIYLSYCISRSGTYLSRSNGIEVGESIAYCVGPPLESVYATDAALKEADVGIIAFIGPPSNTNFAGALFTGSQSACKAACDAYETAIIQVADEPIKY